MNARKKASLIRLSIRALQAAGYNCAPASIGGFDIIGLSSTDVVLVRVCTKIPFEADLDELRQVTAPPNCRKLIHLWPRRSRLAEVREL